MSKIAQGVFTKDGGYLVRSSAGNFSYAYPTSAFEVKARKQPLIVARLMAQTADEDADYTKWTWDDYRERHQEQQERFAAAWEASRH